MELTRTREDSQRAAVFEPPRLYDPERDLLKKENEDPYGKLFPEFRITYEDFAEKVPKTENGIYSEKDIKETLLEFLKIQECDIIEEFDLKELSATVNFNYKKLNLNKYDNDKAVIISHALLCVSSEKALERKCEKERSEFCGKLEENFNKDELLNLTEMLKMETIPSNMEKQEIINMISKFANEKYYCYDLILQEFQEHTEKMLLAEAEDQSQTDNMLDQIENDLNDFHTAQIYGIAQECFDQPIPEWMKKKPSDLKKLLLKKAKSNSLTMGKMVELVQQIKNEKEKIEECLKSKRRSELIEIKKSMNMSSLDTKSGKEMITQIMNHMRKNNLSIHDLERPSPSSESENIQPMDVDAKGGEIDLPANIDVTPAMDEELPFISSESKASISSILETLHNEQVKKIVKELNIKISESTFNRPKDLRLKIVHETKNNLQLMERCKCLCDEYQKKNAELDFLTDFSHAELHEMAKFMGMKNTIHINKAQLGKQLKNFIITNDISLTQLLDKMQEKNHNVQGMIKYLNNCLNRSALNRLKGEMGMKVKGHRTTKEIVTEIVKQAGKKDMTTKDLQQKLYSKMKSESLAKEKHLKSCLGKDLDLLNDLTFIALSGHLSQVLAIKALTKERLISNIVSNEKNLKFVANFFEYHFFMNCSNYNMLSEMDLDGLREVANQEKLNSLLHYQYEDLKYHLMEHFKYKCFNDFIELKKMGKKKITPKEYLEEFESRMNEAPEWINLKDPQKLDEQAQPQLTYRGWLACNLRDMKYGRCESLKMLTQQYKLMYEMPCSEPDLSSAIRRQQRLIFDFLEWENSEYFDHIKHLENYDFEYWKIETEIFMREYHEAIIKNMSEEKIQNAIKEFCQQDVSGKFWNLTKLQKMEKKDLMNLLKEETTDENHQKLLYWNLVIHDVKAINARIPEVERELKDSSD